MQYTTRGIVLHATAYNDKYAIVSVYTEAFGRTGYLVPRGRSKKAAAAKALFLPFSVLEIEAEQFPRRDLHQARECRFCFPQTDIFCHPVKNILAQFLAEVLFRTIRGAEADPALFHYIYNAVVTLENTDEGIANYHLVFLLNLLHYLGIYPNTALQRENSYFDLLNGEFTLLQPAHRHYLNLDESRILARLLRMSFENMAIHGFSRQERVYIIRRIFEYYRLHLPDFPEIKSLAILQSLFE